MITIAVDFDGTITAIPAEIASFVDAVKASGNRCIVVTRRYNTEENQTDVAEFLKTNAINADRVIFAGALQKQAAANQAGETVSIWMDDTPGSIPIRRVQKNAMTRPHRARR
jgi:hypothetical protein